MSRKSLLQLELPLSRPSRKSLSVAETIETHRRRIAGHLTIRLPEPVDVIFTNNRSTMVSSKRLNGRIVVRLHRLFRHANEETLDFLALYLGMRDKKASARIDAFIAAYKNEIRHSAVSNPTPMNSDGQYHNLKVVLERVSKTYFGGKVDVQIGWTRRPARKGRKNAKTVSRALATYSYRDRTIRVSPILDAIDVPEYVIDWIVYHEMLHHVLPVEKSNGIHRYHTRRFKTLERAFIHYREAKAWEKVNTNRLLS
ncbi:MAG: M48 family metallopeptidase [Proteobacteria bacterium]|nr:M48 family metallopeptidase [Pseudomonadota bacterium]